MAKKAKEPVKEDVNFVVRSHVSSYAKERDLRVSSDFKDAMNTKVEQLLADAVNRCVENSRSTLRPCDL